MSNATSLAFDASDALLAAIEARTLITTDGIMVDYGIPKNLEPDHIWVDPAIEPWTSEPADSGLDDLGAWSPTFDQSFVLSVKVWVERGTDDWTVVRDRLIALADEVEAALEADVTLGGHVATSYIASRQVIPGVGDNVIQLGLVLGIACAIYGG